MELVEKYRGFEVRWTSAGHLVVADPIDSKGDRANLVLMLASAGMLDALFFPSLAEARRTIDGFLAAGLTHTSWR